jgi:pimeloyl-ACP methyl ester carboxylesterase
VKLVFQDQAFSFELLRAVGYTVYNGADIGECLATATRIKEGDFESWHTEWSRTAQRVQKIAEHCVHREHTLSARNAFLRASNYYRIAEFFLHANPNDPRILATWQASRDCFVQAATLFSFPCEAIEIPYEGSTLPGYLYCVDHSGTPRPTLIFHGGFDSTVEELYFGGAAAALEHGYNCLTFDGPGQGRAIRQQSLPFRPDWEVVVTPVVDYALNRSEIDPNHLALMGMSQGGYFAPRAAAFEPRIKALIAYDGVFNCYGALHDRMPQVVASLIEQGPDEAVNALLQVMSTLNSSVRWALTNGMWTFQAATPRTFLDQVKAYTLEGCVQQIACPTLVLAAENDQFFRGQPEVLYEQLSCPKTFMRFTVEEGAEEHCHVGALTLFHQRLFDWLDETWAQNA